MSFPLRLVIDLVPADEEAAAQKRARDKRAWLVERGYRIVTLASALVETDLAAALGQIDQNIG